MDLTRVNDDVLINETIRLVRAERELLTKVLHHLREHERRRLYGTHSSLFAYATNELGYSEDQAVRRIAAMRLLKDLPQLESKLAAGVINLSHVSIAHSLFSSEKKRGRPLTATVKLEVFNAIEGRSAREAQKVVLAFSTEPPRSRESVRAIGDGLNLATIELTDETLAKFERLKGLLAHVDPHMKSGNLVDRLCDLGLEHFSPAREPARQIKKPTFAAIRRRVWQRDGGACVQCGSTFALEIDHVRPRALGGDDSIDNLRLLCRTCNQRAAIEALGHAKMDPYLSRTTH